MNSKLKVNFNDLIFARMYYFAFMGGWGFILPFMNLFFVSLGLSGKQIGVKKVRISVPGFDAEAGEVGEFPHRDGVRDLEPKLKIIRHLIAEPVQILATRKGVEGGIHADGFENFGIFGQGLLLKTAHRQLAPVLIAFRGVKLP